MIALCVLISVALVGCSGGDEEHMWPWEDQDPPAPAADFAGMWDLDPTLAFPDEDGWGFLYIEEPCMYMVEDINQPHDPQRRDVIRLPEYYTRYNSQTQSIWVFNNGPVTTGDEVTTGGNWTSGTNNPKLYETCPANGQFMAKSMHSCAIFSYSPCLNAREQQY